MGDDRFDTEQVWPENSYRGVPASKVMTEPIPVFKVVRAARPNRVRQFIESSMGQGLAVAVILASGILGALVVVRWLT